MISLRIVGLMLAWWMPTAILAADPPNPGPPAACRPQPFAASGDIPDAAAIPDVASAIAICRRIDTTYIYGEIQPELAALRPALIACLVAIGERFVTSKEAGLEVLRTVDSIDSYFGSCTVDAIVPLFRSPDELVRHSAYSHIASSAKVASIHVLLDEAFRLYASGGLSAVDPSLLRAIREFGPEGRAEVQRLDKGPPGAAEIKKALLSELTWTPNPLRTKP